VHLKRVEFRQKRQTGVPMTRILIKLNFNNKNNKQQVTPIFFLRQTGVPETLITLYSPASRHKLAAKRNQFSL